MSSLSLLVDAQGNPCSGTFGSPLPTTNIAGASTGKSAGLPIGGLSPSGNLIPLSLDATGAVKTQNTAMMTVIATSQSTVVTGTAAGRVMISAYNASATTWQRVVGIFAQCPPQVNTSGGLLGTSTSYLQVPFGVYRITGHSGGTLLVPEPLDPSDDAGQDPAYTVRTGSTVTGRAAAATLIWDAAYNGTSNIGGRPDITAKQWTMPPGYGIAVVLTQAISISVPFFMSITTTQSAS